MRSEKTRLKDSVRVNVFVPHPVRLNTNGTRPVDQIVQSSPHDPGGKHSVAGPACGKGSSNEFGILKDPIGRADNAPSGSPQLLVGLAEV